MLLYFLEIWFEHMYAIYFSKECLDIRERETTKIIYLIFNINVQFINVLI